MQSSKNGREIIQWIVRGIGNDRFWDYLGPLSNNYRPAELLPHLISANDYIKCDKEREARKPSGPTNTKYTRTSKTSDTNKTSIVCFRCHVAGHTSKECTKKVTMVCFRCSKPGHKSSECRTRKLNTGSVKTDITSPTRQQIVSETHNKYYD